MATKLIGRIEFNLPRDGQKAVCVCIFSFNIQYSNCSSISGRSLARPSLGQVAIYIYMVHIYVMYHTYIYLQCTRCGLAYDFLARRIFYPMWLARIFRNNGHTYICMHGAHTQHTALNHIHSQSALNAHSVDGSLENGLLYDDACVRTRVLLRTQITKHTCTVFLCGLFSAVRRGEAIQSSKLTE